MVRGACRLPSRTLPQAGRIAGLTAAALLLASCKPVPPALEQIRERHELRVVTLNLPTSYYLGSQGTEGLEFELARSFAAKLGVTLSMYPVANERAMQAALPCDPVVTMDSDHSPFLCAPRVLAAHLANIASVFAAR